MKKIIKNLSYIRLALLAIFAIFATLFFVSPLVGISDIQIIIEASQYESLYNTIIASWAIYLINSFVCLFGAFAFGYTLFGKKYRDKSENVLMHLCVLPLINIIFDAIMSFTLTSGLGLPVAGIDVAALIFSVFGIAAIETARFLKTNAKINYFVLIGGILLSFIGTVIFISGYESGDSYTGMQLASFIFYIFFIFAVAGYFGFKIYTLFASEKGKIEEEKFEEKPIEKDTKVEEKVEEIPTENEDPVAKLKELKTLLDEGIITQEIYDQKAKKYIDKL